jgi:hypothetical protein
MRWLYRHFGFPGDARFRPFDKSIELDESILVTVDTEGNNFPNLLVDLLLLNNCGFERAYLSI